MIRQIVENLELFSEAQLEALEFLPEALENIESELYPSLESISLEEVAKDLEAYFEGGGEQAGLEVRRRGGAGGGAGGGSPSRRLTIQRAGLMANTPSFDQRTFTNAKTAIRTLTYEGLWGLANTILTQVNVRIDRQGNTGNAQNIQVQTNGINSRTIAAVLVPSLYQNDGNDARARAMQAELLGQVKRALERSLYSWKSQNPSIWTITGNFSNNPH